MWKPAVLPCQTKATSIGLANILQFIATLKCKTNESVGIVDNTYLLISIHKHGCLQSIYLSVSRLGTCSIKIIYSKWRSTRLASSRGPFVTQTIHIRLLLERFVSAHYLSLQ